MLVSSRECRKEPRRLLFFRGRVRKRRCCVCPKIPPHHRTTSSVLLLSRDFVSPPFGGVDVAAVFGCFWLFLVVAFVGVDAEGGALDAIR